LIHGWGVTYAIWQNLAPLLTPYFRLIMIELPGIGGSPEADPQKPYYESCAEAINEVRNALGIEQWSLLAYSTGTRAAEAYVRRYPQTVTRVVFLCPVYLQEIWALCLRLLDAPHAKTLHEWILSDWRLYNAICALGFNWHRHDYTHSWQNEIELQPVDSLIRSLAEMPGKGRAPFDVPAVPTLFVWGSHDAVTAKPRRLRPHDILIPANHSAPVLAAAEVAAAVLPFLTTGELQTQESKATRQRTAGKGQRQGRVPIVPFLSLRTPTPYAVWRIWRTALYRQKRQSTRSKKEVRLMSRLRIRGNNKLGGARERRGKVKEHHLLGRRQKKVRDTTHSPKKRFFLDHSSHNTRNDERQHFFRRLDRTSILPRNREQKP
jgi:pimeloyl-ACP methyl ester carboxylesterase